MDSRLERYLDQQDSAYTAYLESSIDNISTVSDRARQLTYEIRGIEKILAIDDKYSLVTPEHWHEQLRECRGRLKSLLIEEQASIQGTIDLHCQGLIKCNTRWLEIEAELKQVGEALNVQTA